MGNTERLLLLGLCIVGGIIIAVAFSSLQSFFFRRQKARQQRKSWRKSLYTDEAAFVPSDKHWALAVGSIYRSWWGEPTDKLVYLVRSKADNLESLKNDWGIENLTDLLSRTMSLYHEGHRRELSALQAQASTAPQVNLLAWDLVRVIMLASDAVSVGYLQPDKAYNLMLHASHQLQQTYGSWAEMGEGFLAGRRLWRRHRAAKYGSDDQSLERTIALLEHEPCSPWSKIPWAYPLSAPASYDFFSKISAWYLEKEHLENERLENEASGSVVSGSGEVQERSEHGRLNLN